MICEKITRDSEVRVDFLVNHDVEVMRCAELVSEHLVSPARGVDLCVIEATVLIKGHFASGVQYQHGHQSVDRQILNDQIDALALALLRVECQHCELLLVTDLEVMEGLVVLRRHEVLDFLHKFLNALVFQSEILIVKGQVTDIENHFFGEVFHALCLLVNVLNHTRVRHLAFAKAAL